VTVNQTALVNLNAGVTLAGLNTSSALVDIQLGARASLLSISASLVHITAGVQASLGLDAIGLGILNALPFIITGVLEAFELAGVDILKKYPKLGLLGLLRLTPAEVLKRALVKAGVPDKTALKISEVLQVVTLAVIPAIHTAGAAWVNHHNYFSRSVLSEGVRSGPMRLRDGLLHSPGLYMCDADATATHSAFIQTRQLDEHGVLHADTATLDVQHLDAFSSSRLSGEHWQVQVRTAVMEGLTHLHRAEISGDRLVLGGTQHFGHLEARVGDFTEAGDMSAESVAVSARGDMHFGEGSSVTTSGDAAFSAGGGFESGGSQSVGGSLAVAADHATNTGDLHAKNMGFEVKGTFRSSGVMTAEEKLGVSAQDVELAHGAVAARDAAFEARRGFDSSATVDVGHALAVSAKTALRMEGDLRTPLVQLQCHDIELGTHAEVHQLMMDAGEGTDARIHLAQGSTLKASSPSGGEEGSAVVVARVKNGSFLDEGQTVVTGGQESVTAAEAKFTGDTTISGSMGVDAKHLEMQGHTSVTAAATLAKDADGKDAPNGLLSLRGESVLVGPDARTEAGTLAAVATDRLAVGGGVSAGDTLFQGRHIEVSADGHYRTLQANAGKGPDASIVLTEGATTVVQGEGDGTALAASFTAADGSFVDQGHTTVVEGSELVNASRASFEGRTEVGGNVVVEAAKGVAISGHVTASPSASPAGAFLCYRALSVESSFSPPFYPQPRSAL
jgi:hypothetical protein